MSCPLPGGEFIQCHLYVYAVFNLCALQHYRLLLNSTRKVSLLKLTIEIRPIYFSFFEWLFESAATVRKYHENWKSSLYQRMHSQFNRWCCGNTRDTSSANLSAESTVFSGKLLFPAVLNTFNQSNDMCPSKKQLFVSCTISRLSYSWFALYYAIRCIRRPFWSA